jgi:hypothetical protein
MGERAAANAAYLPRPRGVILWRAVGAKSRNPLKTQLNFSIPQKTVYNSLHR